MKVKHILENILKGNFTDLQSSQEGKLNIPPSEIARIFNSIKGADPVQVFQSFPELIQRSVFKYLDILIQKKIIFNSSAEQASAILNAIHSDDRSAFFSALQGTTRSKYLEYLTEEHKQAIHDMLGYGPKSVARLVNSNYACIHSGHTVEQAISHLRKTVKDSDVMNVVYVTDKEGKLLDDIPIRRLILCDQTKNITDIMDAFCAKLDIQDSTEDAIIKFKTYKIDVLPVVGEQNDLLGVVTIDDVMKVAETRSTKEMQKFGGLESLDYPYVSTPFFSLVRKRAGWLIILFLSEMLTATAMGYFEVEIAKAVMLALFVPLIISSGGNCGSQAATLIIRALAVGELTIKDWWYVMRREVLTGLTLGIILGAIGFIRITIWQKLHWYDYGPHWNLLAITIFFSLIGIIMWGTLMGSLIPIILKSLKQDPATSSAPFVATLVDVTGLIIYFTIAAVILKGTLL